MNNMKKKKIRNISFVIMFAFSLYMLYLSISLYISTEIDIKYCVSIKTAELAIFCSKWFIGYIIFIVFFFLLVFNFNVKNKK